MKLFLPLIFILLIGMSACHKNQTGSFDQRIQGTWTRACGCPGTSYQFSGDSIHIYTNGTLSNYGIVHGDTAYILCLYCSPAGDEYFHTPMTVNADGSRLYIGQSQLAYICRDTSCTDSSYHRVQ